MARQARLDYEGAFQHIMSRGFKKEKLFHDEQDYKYYIDGIEFYKKNGYKILAYCLMPNHVHLLIKTGQVRLQHILKLLNNRYAQYKARKRGLPGPIFQGRPKSILIESAAQLKIVGHYILNNPVKAGLCKRAEEYPWCSYNLIGNSAAPDWFDDSIILAEFSNVRKDAITMYKNYINIQSPGNNSDYPLKLFRGNVAGSKEFYESILLKFKKDNRKQKSPIQESRIIDINNIIDAKLKNAGITIEDIRTCKSHKVIGLKKELAYLLKELGHKESAEVRQYLGISESALSRYVLQIKKKIIAGDLKLSDLLKVIK